MYTSFVVISVIAVSKNNYLLRFKEFFADEIKPILC